MTLGEAIFSVILATMLVSCVLFVIFGQVTVRKLRKIPDTKQALGIEFASGWDILNVAQALTLPRSVAQKIRRNSMGLEAAPDVLYKHTTVFDRVLARVFYALFAMSGFALIILMVLDWMWNFD